MRLRETLPVIHSSSHSASKAETRRRQDAGLGKIEATRVGRLISRLMRAVGGAQPGALRVGQVEDREALGQVVLGPVSELGRLGLPGVEGLAQEALGLGLVGGVEDRAEAPRHGFALIEARDVSLGVLRQVKRAPLPGPAGQGGAAGGLEAGMVIGDDQLPLGPGEVERLLGACALLPRGRVEAAAAHLGDVEGLFAEAGHDGLGLEAIGVVEAIFGLFLWLGVEKVGALDRARFVDQEAQCFAGAIQAVGQQGRKRGVQGMRFYSLCQGVDSFVGGYENAPKKSPAGSACR